MTRTTALRPLPFALLLAAASLFPVACGTDKDVTVPVEGTVTLGDSPVQKGTISFHPENASGQIATGDIEGGKYKVATGKSAGAPAGAYKVTVSVTVPSDPKDEYSVPKSLINEKYSDPKNTPLKADVKEGGGPYDFKVTK